MSSSSVELTSVLAVDVSVTEEILSVRLSDGRTIGVPVAWFPRPARATPKERSNWRLIGRGRGIHWPNLDEDISVENLLLGQPSGESQRSFQAWLSKRKNKKTTARRESS